MTRNSATREAFARLSRSQSTAMAKWSGHWNFISIGFVVLLEQDIHTCQLMAGLVTEVIGRDAQLKLKMSMAVEPSTMLVVIEKLQPNLVAWAE